MNSVLKILLSSNKPENLLRINDNKYDFSLAKLVKGAHE